MDSPVRPPRDDHPDSVTVPGQSARQGMISGRVVTVLVVSVTFTVIALAVAWLVFH
jgi:hypothetical protein